MVRIDPVELTQQLVRLNTVNPPGQELEAFLLIEGLLDRAGFEVQRVPFGHSRCNLVADWPSFSDGPRRCFTGHLDTVPLGDAPWATDPFSGLIRDGRLHGRGASDMKGGVAALVCAAISASLAQGPYPIRLILTAGEETGCQGARDLVGKFPLGSAQFLIVAEPTLNRVCSGHKGALWLRVRWRGVSAHGSMPSLGENAVVRASEAIASLSHMAFLRDTHPLLNHATLNVGYLTGGSTFNVVPDHAEAGIDIRTLPNQKHAHVIQQLEAACSPGATVEVVLSLDGVATPPDDAWVLEIQRIAREATCGHDDVAYLPYFTDAAVLAPALGPTPVVIVGPGDPGQAHQTDEACDIDQIRVATHIYEQCMLVAFCEHAGRSAELH